MPDPIDTGSRSTTSGIWPEVSDVSRLYDQGAPWCVNAEGHPEANGGYPAASVHNPPHECQSPSLYLDGVRLDLTGVPTGLQIYAARPFLFGLPREAAHDSSTRIVFETYDEPGGSALLRCSLTCGEALRVAAGLVRIVDLIDRMDMIR
jgi:hypothetical protein